MEPWPESPIFSDSLQKKLDAMTPEQHKKVVDLAADMIVTKAIKASALAASCWTPCTEGLTETEQRLLTIETRAEMTPDLLTACLATKLQALVDADPAAAREALEMSEEYAPEMYQIAQERNQAHWGYAIATSDSMMCLMNKLDWAQERIGKPALLNMEPITLLEAMEALP